MDEDRAQGGEPSGTDSRCAPQSSLPDAGNTNGETVKTCDRSQDLTARLSELQRATLRLALEGRNHHQDKVWWMRTDVYASRVLFAHYGWSITPNPRYEGWGKRRC